LLPINNGINNGEFGRNCVDILLTEGERLTICLMPQDTWYDGPVPSIFLSFSSWNRQRRHQLIFQHATTSPQPLFPPGQLTKKVNSIVEKLCKET